VPYWLDEGLAVRFEGTDPERNRARLRTSGPSLPLGRLERSFAGLSAKDAAAAYAVSAAAVDRMFEAAGAPAVVSLLDAIGRGVPFAEAFEHHMMMAYPEFQKRF